KWESKPLEAPFGVRQLAKLAAALVCNGASRGNFCVSRRKQACALQGLRPNARWHFAWLTPTSNCPRYVWDGSYCGAWRKLLENQCGPATVVEIMCDAARRPMASNFCARHK